MSQSTKIVLPGQSLGDLPQTLPGAGTHTLSSKIQASLAGPSHTSKSSKKANSSFIVSVQRPLLSSSGVSQSKLLPSVDDVVLARVTRLQQRQATVEILVIYPSNIITTASSTSAASSTASNISTEGVVAPPGFQGTIRSQDVRATEKDRVKIVESFAIGDVVRGVVVSLGDQSAYYISTAKNEYGVLLATSKDGNRMRPLSWKEFVDPVTGKKEARKVAKPF
jgi:exosome complex component CSL4